jgi:acetoin utilization deacetylase AcuC-like enzyme
MILFEESEIVGLSVFGIDIPVRQSKASRTFEALRSDPELGAQVERWHVRTDTEAVTRQDLLRVHDPVYVQRLYSEGLKQEILKTYELLDEQGNYRRFDPDRAELPLERLFRRALERVSGTWHCCRIALQRGFCFYLGGGMHHAHRDEGKGFCLVNDIVIALRKLQAEQGLETAWVIDVDAHKGDGTAALTREDPAIRTMSVHMAEGWPLDEPEYDELGRFNPSFTPSDIDVPVQSGEEDRYLEKLRKGLDELDRYPSPDLAVVVSGADPFELDELDSARKLALTLEQLLERDRMIYSFLKERGLPRAYLMAGGYGPETWRVYTQFLLWALPDMVRSGGGATGEGGPAGTGKRADTGTSR